MQLKIRLVNYCSNISIETVKRVIRITLFRRSSSDVFLRKGPPKICSKFTGEHPYQSAISISYCNFIELALWYGCSPVNLLHIFRTPYPKTTSGGLLLFVLNLLQRLETQINMLLFFKT